VPDILVDDLAPQVRRITFNRPQALNGFISSMYPEFLGILEKIARDPDARVVVITGAGRGFCSGNDGSVASERNWIPTQEVGRSHGAMYFMRLLNTIGPTIRGMPQPVIAAVNGAAAGLGYSIALACDIAIAAKSAKFVNAFHNAGTGSEIGLSYMLPRAIGMQRAAELLLSGRQVLADEAERIGLVLKTVPDESLMDEVLKIANEMIQCAPLDLWVTKQEMYANQHIGSLADAAMLDLRGTLAVVQSEDYAEKRTARAEKRAPKFKSK
jgi:enoyl-CoA hydratase